MYTIRTRPAGEKEQDVIRRGTRQQFGEWGCVVMVVGIGTVGLWLVGGWIGGFWSPQAKFVGQWIGSSIGIFFLVILAFRLWHLVRRNRWFNTEALRDVVVEHITVTGVQSVKHFSLGGREDYPALAFDIGDGKILFLQGQWLWETHIYGAPLPPSDDSLEEFINGLPAPHSFPSDAFEIERCPHSGDVMSIQVQGKYLTPLPGGDVIQPDPDYDFSDSILCDGTLDDVAGALKKASSHRNVTPTVKT